MFLLSRSAFENCADDLLFGIHAKYVHTCSWFPGTPAKVTYQSQASPGGLSSDLTVTLSSPSTCDDTSNKGSCFSPLVVRLCCWCAFVRRIDVVALYHCVFLCVHSKFLLSIFSMSSGPGTIQPPEHGGVNEKPNITLAQRVNDENTQPHTPLSVRPQ